MTSRLNSKMLQQSSGDATTDRRPFAIEQPKDVDIKDIVLRPTA